jgi:hypothetical protein
MQLLLELHDMYSLHCLTPNHYVCRCVTNLLLTKIICYTVLVTGYKTTNFCLILLLKYQVDSYNAFCLASI